MRSYIKMLLPLVFATILAFYMIGCGDGGFETASRLELTSFSPHVVQSDVVEDTDDTGRDGQSGTGDDGENDNRPQPGEVVTNPLIEDTSIAVFSNTLRAGSTEGVDIEIYRYVISYYDEYGLTPAYAPQTIHDIQAIIPAGSTGNQIEIVVVPMDMKLGWLNNSQWMMGLRDIYLYNYSEFSSVLYAQIDFYARDPLNEEPAFTSGQVEIHFANYIQ